MASPQKENGYTPIAHEILDVFMLVKMVEYERVVFLSVIRKTYGWGKKTDRLSHGQISTITGIARPHVCRAITSLIAKKMLCREGLKIGVQKNWESWLVEWRVLPHQVTGVTSSGNRSVTSSGTHNRYKDNKQECEQSSQLIEKDMAFKKYNENQHSDDTPVIDADSGEIVDLEEEARTAQKDLTAKKNKLIDWLIEWQGRDAMKTNRPKQMKALNELVKMKVSRQEIVNLVKEQEQNEYWKGKQEKPDFSTVVSIIQRRG